MIAWKSGGFRWNAEDISAVASRGVGMWVLRGVLTFVLIIITSDIVLCLLYRTCGFVSSEFCKING